MTNVMPTSRWIAFSSICICSRSLRSSAPSGSSSSNTRGRPMSARASATRCRCPPDSCAGRRRAWSINRTMSSASAVRCRRSALGTPRTFSPYSTFWATVMCGNSAYSWKTVLTSRRRAGSAVTSTPPSLIVPAVGWSNPAIMRSTVVLPEPDGPRIANNSPSPTARFAPSTATSSPKSFRTPISSICGCPTATVTFASGCELTVREGMAHRTHAEACASGRFCT